MIEAARTFFWPAGAESEIPPAQGWREDLRFFATAYAGGFLFFLILLS